MLKTVIHWNLYLWKDCQKIIKIFESNFDPGHFDTFTFTWWRSGAVSVFKGRTVRCYDQWFFNVRRRFQVFHETILDCVQVCSSSRHWFAIAKRILVANIAIFWNRLQHMKSSKLCHFINWPTSFSNRATRTFVSTTNFLIIIRIQWTDLLVRRALERLSLAFRRLRRFGLGTLTPQYEVLLELTLNFLKTG